MKNRVLILAAIAAAAVPLLSAAPLRAQTSSPTLTGAWRADVPLPNGVIQTFRFDTGGTFDLTTTLAVDGRYTANGNQLVETVTLASLGATHTDTSTFAVVGDSLIVTESAGKPARVLHRKPGSVPAPEIMGDWTISIGDGTVVNYSFAADGTMHVRALVGDEKGRYSVSADTLHLSNDRTFQLPATAQYAIAGNVLTLTPLNGKSSRQFHRVATNE